MDTSLWKFKRARTDDHIWHTTDAVVLQDLLDKMPAFLQELFALLDKYNVDLLEDSEGDYKGIELGHRHIMIWETVNPREVTILTIGGRLVGWLMRGP